MNKPTLKRITLLVLISCLPPLPVAVAKINNRKISKLSDEFDKASTLKQWSRVHLDENTPDQLEVFDIGSSYKGELTMVPHSSSWYKRYRGVLAYKAVTGDFIMTTKLVVSGRSGEAASSSIYSLAGIMLRRVPDAIERWENYIFLSTGTADKPGLFHFEVKTTVNSDSKLRISRAESGRAELRVVRLGQIFILMLRKEGRIWQIHQRYKRPDFPSTIQAGLTSYTDWNSVRLLTPDLHNETIIKGGNPDLKARFDFVRFKEAQLPAALDKLNLLDPLEVSDVVLLAFFGESVD